MDHKSLQSQLNDFYRTEMESLFSSNVLDEKSKKELSAPLLLSIPQNYLDAPLRVMFIGKETRGWWGKLWDYYAAGHPIEALLKRYESKIQERERSSAFWRQYIKTQEVLAGGKSGAVIWNNVMKSDYAQGKGASRNSADYAEWLTQFSGRLLAFEFRLLQPHVAIFACGSSYDATIKSHFPAYKTEAIVEPKALWRFRIGETLCYRTFHPQASNVNASLPVGKYFGLIINDIQQRLAQTQLIKA